jgi:uncharacterized protein HemX
MLSTFFYLAQTSPGVSGGGGDIVTVVYILTSISFIVGFAVGTYKYIQRQKKKWTEEGITRAKQQQTVAENTLMMQKNTAAIDKLSEKFSDFAMSVRQEMNGLGDRLGKLETWRADQTNHRST